MSCCWFRGHLNMNKLNIYKWLEYLYTIVNLFYFAQIQHGSKAQNKAMSSIKIVNWMGECVREKGTEVENAYTSTALGVDL